MKNLTKAELIQLVKDSGVEANIKELVITYIREAYDIGFADGMNMATNTQHKVFDMLWNKQAEVSK